MIDRTRRSRLVVLLAVVLAAAGLAIAADAGKVLREAERATVDARFRLRGGDAERVGPVPMALVLIDDRTMQELGRFPFRRRYHAQVIRRLTRDGARAIAYDVQFTEPSERPTDDDALVRAVAGAPPIVLSTTEVNEDGGTSVLGGDDLLHEIGAVAGNTTVDLDSDGVLRLFGASFDGLVSFPVAVAQRVTGHPVDRRAFGGGLTWVDYVGSHRLIPRYSFSQVVRGQVPASAFRGRIVVVGASAPSLGDVHATPIDAVTPGPELQANAIATVLRGVPLRSAPGWIGLLMTLLAAVLAPLVALRRGPIATFAAAVLGGVLLAAVAYLLFVAADRVVPVAEPAVALLLSTLMALGVSAAYAAIERERTRAIFGRFVASDVVDDVLARTDDLRLGGQRVDATILFCDLRGSTALLEGVAPEAGIAILNRFLTAMSDAVDAHGGTHVGFRGDGLMAVFGAPLDQPDHADRALAAGCEMVGPALQRCLAELREAGLPHDLTMGVGIASGEVMAGNVGSERRMEYTAIGDAANLAARLEGMTKEQPYAVLLAGATIERLRTRPASLVFVGEVPVRGRAQPVDLWAIG
ncbi:CHASE2 domain-containing protein [Patulibacter medicamentivorans]|uniref:CHASE2 domain-containing protein n=1 Tax=Patulibacter medicamentivorans TaxID=1097667 RepID=UPI00058C8DAE|nr:adenylate/guanylate cyclase domain-containing protein [Patulibacter medicamentivorans]